MNPEKKYRIFLLGVIASLILLGCSPTTYAQRYKSGSKKKSKTVKTVPARPAADQNIQEDTTSIEVSNIEELFEEDTRSLDDPEDADDVPVEEAIKTSEIIKRLNSSLGSSSETSPEKEKVIMEIIKYLDTPYKFGGNSWKGIDCSAFTQTVFNNSFSLALPRTAREQYHVGLDVDRSELKFGDLVFFNTRRVKPGHVGIYIGDNLFAHSSSRQGVMVSSLDSDYYAKRFMGGRRVSKVETN